MARDLPTPGAGPAVVSPRVLLEFKVLWGRFLSLSESSPAKPGRFILLQEPHQHAPGWLAKERVENKAGRAVVLLVRGCWGSGSSSSGSFTTRKGEAEQQFSLRPSLEGSRPASVRRSRCGTTFSPRRSPSERAAALTAAPGAEPGGAGQAGREGAPSEFEP